MRVAVIGKSAFGADVFERLVDAGHEVVVVCTEPDRNGRPDLIALAAEKRGTPVIKTARWRRKNTETGAWEVIPEVFDEYKKYRVDLNVLPFCTQFIPSEMINYPKHKTIIYHPSILPAHRGASAINWTLINGDTEAGLTIFWADEGVDTGPIILQRKCAVEENDTLNSIYKRFLFPEGVKATVDAVNLIKSGEAPRIVQPTEGASYEPYITAKPELAEIDWSWPQIRVHNFIRGNDSVPGAWTTVNGEKVILFGSSLWKRFEVPGNARQVTADGLPGGTAWTHDKGLLIKTIDNKYINVENLKFADGRMIKATQFGSDEAVEERIVLTDEEKALIPSLKGIWKDILNVDVDDETNFFESGASSADLTRMIEEINSATRVVFENTEAYLTPTFGEFVNALVKKLRGDDKPKIQFEKYEAEVNGMMITVPTQMLINGKFSDSESGRKMDTIDPSDEKVICQVPRASAADVDHAVRCAEEAFAYGEWSRLSARERGRLLFRLADLMEEHKQELATIESIDSGAVYTLALKTHVGMSIDVWRYFAGWCDKIQGKTIPISDARPNFNLCLTVRQPIGVVGLITPWNYPLMMLSWKMAACLAAGNTVVHKPAQVSPLTALKFAELATRAGVPPGVINIVTGTGSEVGQAIVDHPRVRKVGFTGSTPVGAQLMASCAKSNLKKVSLELGGKSPLIIFNDVDLCRTVRQACDAVFFNKGENCISAGRIFVEESIHDEFVRRAVMVAERLVIGHPLNRKTDHGPQNHLAHLKSLERFVEQSVADGARVACGGGRVKREGLFFQPTILVDVEDENFAAVEESFGPIMIISKFNEKNVDETIERANRTEYGLAGGVFSRDVNRAMRVARRLKAGTIFVNTYQKTDVAAPFGGFKQSGFGKDLGEEALDGYLETKTITMEY